MAYQRRVREGKLTATVPLGSVAYMQNLVKIVLESDPSKITIQQIQDIATDVSNDITWTQAAACKDYVTQRLSSENL